MSAPMTCPDPEGTFEGGVVKARAAEAASLPPPPDPNLRILGFWTSASADLREWLGVSYATRACVFLDAAGAKGQRLSTLAETARAVVERHEDPEILLVQLGGHAASFHRFAAGAESDLREARIAVTGILSHNLARFDSDLAAAEAKHGPLDVARLAPPARAAFEALAAIRDGAFERERRAATIATIRRARAAFSSNWWAKPSEFPAQVASPKPEPDTKPAPKRGRLLGMLKG